MVGVAPFLGGLMLPGIFIKAFIDYNKDRDITYSGKFLGFGVRRWRSGSACSSSESLVMFIANVAYPKFFKRKRETAEPGILEGTVSGEASVMAD